MEIVKDGDVKQKFNLHTMDRSGDKFRLLRTELKMATYIMLNILLTIVKVKKSTVLDQHNSKIKNIKHY
ncbi:hypothetical protein D7Z54_33480 [Salibacterium salarium]|uniref:Uncharacterized protein n=1 Tax=Salibacterium salarium TaxID=284579 RepID=A0A3R9WLK5_9BACI|nr:hypothetical protein D7Z54_33480 [Salibacterium salarium]